MPDLFLSYKREDEAKAEALVNALRGAGLDVWWDRDIPTGAPWEATIERALHESKSVVVCWSPASVASENVRSEARWAREEGKLLQVFLEPCRPPLFFGERQGVDLGSWSGAADDRRIVGLVASVSALASGEAAPEAAAWRHPTPRPKLPDARLLIVGGAALVVVVAGLAAWGLIVGAGGARQNGRVEVAAFTARQGDPELQRLAADIGDAEIRLLTRSSIDAAARAGSGGDGDPAELRLSGSLDRDGANIVVNTQVTDRKSGLVLLSTQQTRPATSLAGFADQIGMGTASALSCTLEDRRQSRKAMKPDVLRLYLNACDSITREGNFQRMLENTQRVIEAAPKLAIGHALHAIAQGQQADQIVHDAPAEAETLRRGAREAAGRALALDPKTPKAYLAISNSYPTGTHFLEREQALLKAREVDPKLGPGRISYVSVLREVGRLREALQVALQVHNSNDARIGGGSRDAVMLSAQIGDLDQAEELLAQMEKINHLDAQGARWTMLSLWAEGADGLRRLRQMEHANVNPKAYACALTFVAELDRRRATHAHGLPPGCENIPPGRRIQMLAREGDMDGAFAEFEKNRAETFLGYLYGPAMAGFRADPRFMPMAARIGLAEYWVKSGHWPDFCSEPGLQYDCKAAAAAALKAQGKA